MSLYLGRWRWRTEGEESFWWPPAGTVAHIDLRNAAQCAQKVTAEGFGLFDIPNAPAAGLELIGADLEDIPSNIIKTRIENLLGLPRVASWKRCGDIIWELLTVRRAVITGTGLMPTSKRKLELHLGKWSRIKDFGIGVEEWAGVQADLRAQYRAHKQDKSLPKDHHRKVLSAWCEKYGTQDWQLFVPDDLPREGPLPHGTPITDGFNRANGALGVDWTVDSGGPTISGERAISGTTSSTTAKHNTALSVDDMYCQAKIYTPTINGATQRVCVRLANISNYYMALIRQNGATQDIERWKNLAGALTPVGGEITATTWTSGGTLRIESDGSNHRVLVNGSEVLANVSDVSLSGTLTAGISFGGTSQGGAWDDFEADILGALPPEIPSDVIPRRAIKSWHYR